MDLGVEIKPTAAKGVFQAIVHKDDRIWICLYMGIPDKDYVLQLWHENRQAFHAVTLEDE
jgi:hypothetical protein